MRLAPCVLAVALVLPAACGNDDTASAPAANSDTAATTPATGDDPAGTHGPATTDPATGSGSDPGDDATTGSSGAAPDDGTGPPCDGAEVPAGTRGTVGWADVDGDGSPELWVRTGAGASTALLGLVRYDDDCQPQRVTLDGQPAELPVGGSVTNAAGVSCGGNGEAADVTAYSATSVDGETYEVAALRLRLEDDDLVEVGVDVLTIEASDPEFPRYASFTCGSLTL
jgi:hypothetical protein